MNLTHKILFGLITGLICGLILHPIAKLEAIDAYIIQGILHIASSAFLSSLKLVVVPLVLVSIVCGTVSMENLKKLQRIGSRTFLFYLATTMLAIVTALILGHYLQPGKSFNLTPTHQTTTPSQPKIIDMISNIFPSNPFQAMLDGNMLQIIIIAILIGLSINKLGPEKLKPVLFFKQSEKVLLKLVEILIQIAPYGIFAVVAKTFATEGFSAMVPLLIYFAVVVLALLVHLIVVYTSLIKVFTKISPLDFFRRIRQVIIFAFSTASSSATLPITIDVAERRLGVSPTIASFTLPLGATINMDGTAIMQGVATCFIAQAYGIELEMSQYLSVIATATLASIGTAGVPGVGLVMLTMVVQQVGLPVEGIALIMGVDRILDMIRTAINVIGDMVITTVIASGEKAIELPNLGTLGSDE